ncbi:MAG: DUF115 domain-containing protein [Bdellovibrionaceae bacterium]|nr:DUF115 domain-containing protein [Pseudobdellovibrionaceae bacterium]
MLDGTTNTEGVGLAGSPQPIAYDEGWDPAFIDMATANMAHTATLGLPEVDIVRPHDTKALIVGSSPSLPSQFETIKKLKAEGAKIFAINDAMTFLVERGVIPDCCVIFEICDDVSVVLKQVHPDITYYVCSMCHPSTFRKLLFNKVVVWHLDSDQEAHQDLLGKFENPIAIGGGTYTFTRTLPVALVLGYRDFEIFGTDCSQPDEGSSHYFGEVNYNGSPMKIRAAATNGEEITFTTRPPWARQADEFRRMCKLHHHMFKCKVHGNGLLHWIHSTMYPQFYQESEQ